MRRKGKVSTIEGLGRRDVGSGCRSGANAKENPLEVMEPIGSGCAGLEGVLKPAMKALCQTIRLRMIGSGGAVLNVERETEAVPKSRGKLWATVRGDGGGDAKAGNPVVN